MKHVLFQCPVPCDGPCQFCDGGLAYCTVCGGGEAELPTDCPGRRMTDLLRERVAAGMLDFVGSRWVDGPKAKEER